MTTSLSLGSSNFVIPPLSSSIFPTRRPSNLRDLGLAMSTGVGWASSGTVRSLDCSSWLSLSWSSDSSSWDSPYCLDTFSCSCSCSGTSSWSSVLSSWDSSCSSGSCFLLLPLLLKFLPLGNLTLAKHFVLMRLSMLSLILLLLNMPAGNFTILLKLSILLTSLALLNFLLFLGTSRIPSSS